MRKFKPHPLTRACVSALMTCAFASACGDTDPDMTFQSRPDSTQVDQLSEHVELATSTLANEPEHFEVQAVTQALLQDATTLVRDHATANSVSARRSRQFVGLWRTKTFEQGAWVDLIWVVGKRHAWHVVTAYADQQLTVPLVRWDIVRNYQLEKPARHTPERYGLVWTDLASWLTPYVNNPALFEQIGLADCELVAGVRRDVSVDNCGAPLFPFRDCPLLDFVELTDNGMTFGDPREGDRCEQRPTRYEGWSFERVWPTPELVRRLTDA